MAGNPEMSTSEMPEPVKPIPKDAFANQQLDLFQSFLANTDEDRNALSNSVDLWDAIPRYTVSRARQNRMRTAEGFLDVLEIPFHYRKRQLTALIYPARIMGKNGKRVSYYPSAREELIEHALRKISVEQLAGFYHQPTSRSGTRFSLHQLRAELAQQDHTLRYDELTEGLDILSLSAIEIRSVSEDGEEAFARSNYLGALTGVKRKDYDADRTARWAVQFHPLVTQSIERVAYRQMNYQRLMKCKTQIARWLLAQLILKYTQAAPTNSFQIRYSTIKRDSSMLHGYMADRQAIAKLDEAWKELKDLGAVSIIERADHRGKHAKLEDVTYTIYPSRDFVSEQKAANRRQGDGKTLAGQDILG